MINPFTKEGEQVQYAMFAQLTKAINDWMLEEYPTYDNQLEAKIERCLKIQLTLDKRQNEIEQKVKDIKETVIREAKSEIANFLAKEYPDISGRLAMASVDLKDTAKKMKKNQEEIAGRMQKLVHSTSLTEDVYKMRDEMKEMKKFYETTCIRLKKLFG